MSHVTRRDRNGRVSFEAVITDDAHPKGEWTKTFAAKGKALDFVKNIEGQKVNGQWVSPILGAVLFCTRYQIWLDGRVGRDSTQEVQENYGRSLILPTFGLMTIGEITHDHIQGWIKELIDAGYSPGTIVKAHLVLSKVLGQCVANRLLASNPCDHSELPSVEMEEMRFSNPDQIIDITEVFDPRYTPFPLLGAYSGLRAGEMFGLRVGRIDAVHDEISVAENCVVVRNKPVFHKPKTRAGKRVVPIPRFLTEILLAYTDGKNPTDLVFTAPNPEAGTDCSTVGCTKPAKARGLCRSCYGRAHYRKELPPLGEVALGSGPVNLRNFRKRVWYPAMLATGLGVMNACAGPGCEMCRRAPNTEGPKHPTREHYDGLRIHDLRHTAVSLWIAQGANQLEVARWAGHSSIATVYDRYGHLFPRDEDPAINKLDALGRAALGRLKTTKR